MNNSTASNLTTDITVTDSLRRIVFTCYFLTALTSLLLSTLIFIVIIKHRQNFNTLFYKLFCSMLACQLYTALFYGIYGASCTLLKTCGSGLVNGVLGDINWMSFSTASGLNFAIGCDRFVAIVLFKKCSKKRPFVAKAVLIGALLTGPVVMIPVTVLYPVFHASVVYYPDFFLDYFDNITPEMDIYNQVNGAFQEFLMCASMALYICCIVKLLWMKLKQQTQYSSTLKIHITLMLQGIVHQGLMVLQTVIICIVPVTESWSNFGIIMISQTVTVLTCLIVLLLNSTFKENMYETLSCLCHKPAVVNVQPITFAQYQSNS